MMRPLKHIEEMAAYSLADLSASSGKRVLALSQNESMRGPSPLVSDAVARSLNVANLYPDPNWTALRQQIARIHKIDPTDVICGNGSLDLIGALARAYLAPGYAGLAPVHAYPFFRTATLLTGARFDTAPEDNLAVDVDALLAAVTPETRIVFVANPGNPTGTRISRQSLVRLRDRLPSDTLLVIDEAYGEFADHLSEPMFDLVARGDTVILRTFSKAYGLAGMRVGWGLFPAHIAEHVRKLLNPNNVSIAGQLAAEAALTDLAYMRETCEITGDTREAFVQRMRNLGLIVPDSYTNFVLLQFPSAAIATEVDTALRHEGVILRPQGGAGLPDCLRATVGNSNDMEAAAGLIEGLYKGKEIP